MIRVTGLGDLRHSYIPRQNSSKNNLVGANAVTRVHKIR